MFIRYLQLSISMEHNWRSIGKYWRFIGHEAVIVNLIRICIFKYDRIINSKDLKEIFTHIPNTSIDFAQMGDA